MIKTITYQDIIKLNSCYDPIEIGMPEDYEDTIVNCIKEYRDKVKDKSDIIWLFCRSAFLNKKQRILFGIGCAREALKLIDNPDQRSIKACNIAEKFTNGEATQEELNDAVNAAYAVNDAVAYDAVNDAAAYAAAYGAAYDAAYAAAYAAVYDDAYDAAAYDAAYDAYAAAYDAAYDAQINKLLELIKEHEV